MSVLPNSPELRSHLVTRPVAEAVALAIRERSVALLQARIDELLAQPLPVTVSELVDVASGEPGYEDAPFASKVCAYTGPQFTMSDIEDHHSVGTNASAATSAKKDKLSFQDECCLNSGIGEVSEGGKKIIVSWKVKQEPYFAPWRNRCL